MKSVTVKEMPTIHLHPCVDGLLYAPVYAALLSILHRPGTQAYKPKWNSESQIAEFAGDDGYSVKLHPPARSDEAVLEILKRYSNTPTELHIGVGDPKAVLTAPRPQNGRRFQLVGAFVNRIALWAVCRTDGFTGLGANKKKSAAKEICERVRSGDKNFSHKARDHWSSLRLGYCTKGATTSTVIDRFVGPGYFDGPQHPPQELGKAELAGLIDNDYDITFSYAPWLLPPMLGVNTIKDVKGFEVLPWFQSIPYPFSGLSIYSSDDEAEIIQENLNSFMQFMVVGLTFLYRYKRSAKQLLKQHASVLRHFEIEKSLDQNVRDRMITEAFQRLIFDSDCFSDALDSAITSWDLTMKVAPEPSDSDFINLVRRARECQERNTLYLAADPKFLAETMPEILKSLVNEANLDE